MDINRRDFLKSSLMGATAIGLKKINYQGYVRYECGIKGDRAILVPASINLLRKQWRS